MNINVVDDIGVENISQANRTKNGVGICFFDPITEELLEFDESTRIPIYPLEESFRKFFIVKDDVNFPYNIVALKASLVGGEYIVKLTPSLDLDIKGIPENNTIIEFFSNHPTGIIPFYIYTKSLSTSFLEANLKIELELRNDLYKEVL